MRRLVGCRDSGRHTTDGPVELWIDGASVEVFCYMMGPRVAVPGAPFEYITLPSPDTNIAQWITGQFTITTRFSRLRLDLPNRAVRTGDCTSRLHSGLLGD